ncbi:hypothetical protein ILUMI_01143 [Ignelater luminosus]|uniref:Uncharacterized protein n=1 Tax=Ignelater luminosus TaxID=2038154 RepID=A0A8K0DKK3_IGNLU|nr:hypothetical protein ILUMI_01143 [Ignelater luminosus]
MRKCVKKLQRFLTIPFPNPSSSEYAPSTESANIQDEFLDKQQVDKNIKPNFQQRSSTESENSEPDNTKLVGLEDEREKEIFKNANKAHLNTAEVLRREMNKDLLEAKNTAEVETLTFDLQKTHPILKIPTGIAYYKRQLNLYNLDIHESSQNQGIFNV